MSESDTERIELPDGNFWIIRTRLTRRMDKAVTQATLASIPQIVPNGNLSEEDVKAKLLSNVGAVNIGAIEDAYLRHGTVAYSFGPVVSMEVIDELDSTLVRRVLTRMFELYGSQRVTEEAAGGFFGKPSSAS